MDGPLCSLKFDRSKLKILNSLAGQPKFFFKQFCPLFSALILLYHISCILSQTLGKENCSTILGSEGVQT